MHTRSKHKDNNNITGEQSLNNKDTHELDHIGDTRHKEQRNKEKQQETTSKICVKEKKEPKNYAMENDAKKNDAQ